MSNGLLIAFVRLARISGSPPDRDGAVRRAAHTTGIKKTA